MMHKKAHKLFAEDKQTKDMDYWNHVLWSDETKVNLIGLPCNNVNIWRKNINLRIILIYYMKLYKNINFLPLYLQFCDHSKCIFKD